MAKCAQHCIEKYIRGSGLDDALVETQVYGKKSLNKCSTVLIRSLRVILILVDSINRLKWDAFWENNKKEKYKETLPLLETFNYEVTKTPPTSCFDTFTAYKVQLTELENDFTSFFNESEKSQMCKYLNNILYIANLLQDLICADRTGDWEKHLRTVEKLLSIFQQRHSINYLRYDSLYLEKMRQLSDEFPEIYDHFKNVEFVAKGKPSTFNAVSPDMKLEQTIQRSKKSQSGIIGQARQNSYVTEWELVYHKILNISNLFHGITSSRLSFRETDLHHELGGSISTLLNESTRKVTTFLAERGNPYLVTSSSITKLHHFTTGQCVNENDANRTISIIEDGNKQYVKSREKRFVKKEKKLSDTIKKNILSSFELGQKSVNKTSINIKKILKTQGEIQQNFDIACSGCFTIKNILRFYLGFISVISNFGLAIETKKICR